MITLDRQEKVNSYFASMAKLVTAHNFEDRLASAAVVVRHNAIGLGFAQKKLLEVLLPVVDRVTAERAIAHALTAHLTTGAADRPVDAPSNGHDADAPTEFPPGYSGPGPGDEPEVDAPKREPAQAVWSEPKPLPAGDGLLPVAPFDVAFLPNSIAPWVEDIAERMQCPVDYVAIPAMVALGSVIGRKVSVRPLRKTDWYEVANLWALIIGPPGSMKSPGMAEAMAPLRRLEAKAWESNETARKAYEAALADHKMREDAARKRRADELKKDPQAPAAALLEEPDKPKARQFIVDDATYEALGALLVDNPNGVLAYRDEIMSLLKTLEREEQAAARGFFLAAWGGKESYGFERIGRGKIRIEAACLSLLGATQPAKIAEYVRAIAKAGGSDGMIERVAGLGVWPDGLSEWREVDRYANSEAKDAAWDVFERLSLLDSAAVDAIKGSWDKVPYLNFDPAAQRIFSTWHRNLETLVLRDDELSASLKGHFSKYKKIVPALALINHLADGGTGEISKATIVRGVNFSRYLETHAKRIYAAGRQTETTAAKAILAHIRRGDLVDGFTAREIHQKGWSTLDGSDVVKEALELLGSLGWLADREVKRPGGGRPTVAYFVNPKAKA
jgi:hypothetical protein